MAHDSHGHDTVVDDRSGFGAGMMVALVAIVVLALVAFAVLWTQPWDDNDSDNNSVPGITDDSGGIDNPVDGGAIDNPVDNPVDGDGGVDNPVDDSPAQ